VDEVETRVLELFGAYPGRYWVAGGWAVDLRVGRQRREHTDLDILVLLADLGTFAEVFAGRTVTVTDHRGGGTWPWDPAKALEPGRHTLAFADEPGLEILLGLHEGDDWVFHRGQSTRRSFAAITRTTARGVPYLSPEVVLRLKSREPREKDQADFDDLVDLLTTEQVAWLLPRLGWVDAPEHPWRARLHGLQA
jgi:hypothetical protein